MSRKKNKTKYVIKFSFHPYRTDFNKSNFNSKLSAYWEKQYTDMFKGWKE